MLNKLIIIILCFSLSLANAQTDEAPIKPIKLADVSFQAGFMIQQSDNTNLSTFQQLAPESEILQNDFSSYNSSLLGGTSGNSIFYGLLGIQFRNKQTNQYRENVKLRIGLGYNSYSVLNTSLNNEDRFTYDTLVSSQTGQTFYSDSITFRTLALDNYIEQIAIDASIIVNTSPEKRWQLFTGIGINAGFTINSVTSINYFKYSRSETDLNSENYSGSTFQSESPMSRNETFRNNNSFSAIAYIPIGVDFRIGKNNELLRKLHVYWELRPSILYNNIPDLFTLTRGAFSQSLGVRYSF